jgi:hypothetical protein
MIESLGPDPAQWGTTAEALSVTLNRRGDLAVLVLTGAVTARTVELVEAVAETLIEPVARPELRHGVAAVVADLTRVRILDIPGRTGIMEVRRRLADHGIRMSIRQPGQAPLIDLTP